MEGFKPEQVPAPESGPHIPDKELFERVSAHSKEFDRQAEEERSYTEREVRDAFRTEEWKIGETDVQAIGVEHVPETFLYFREKIEKAIQESDVVVNEFAPEALGMYDKTQSKHLEKVRSKFNEDYNLEQLREAFVKFQRPWNIGTFHHEVELLSAKYGKDMACGDLTMTKDPEAALQGGYIYAYGAEQVAADKARKEKFNLRAASALTGAAALGSLLADIKKPMSRRKFLKMGLFGAAGVLAGATPEIVKTPPERALDSGAKESGNPEFDLLERLRNPELAKSLKALSGSGYKKIAFIYGRNHLDEVKRLLDHPEDMEKELSQNAEVIERNNPDPFRVYRLAPGENRSEEFVAAKDKVWERVR